MRKPAPRNVLDSGSLTVESLRAGRTERDGRWPGQCCQGWSQIGGSGVLATSGSSLWTELCRVPTAASGLLNRLILRNPCELCKIDASHQRQRGVNLAAGVAGSRARRSGVHLRQPGGSRGGVRRSGATAAAGPAPRGSRGGAAAGAAAGAGGGHDPADRGRAPERRGGSRLADADRPGGRCLPHQPLPHPEGGPAAGLAGPEARAQCQGPPPAGLAGAGGGLGCGSGGRAE